MSLIDLTPSPTREHLISHEGSKALEGIAPDVAVTPSATTKTIIKNATYENPQNLENSSASISAAKRQSLQAEEALIIFETDATVESRPKRPEDLGEDLRSLSLSHQSSVIYDDPKSATINVNDMPPPQPPPKDDKYLRQSSPSASTPARKTSPMLHSTQESSEAEWNEKESYDEGSESRHRNVAEGDFDDKTRVDGDATEESRAEISSIIEQFTGDKSQNKDAASPTARDIQASKFPPRVSSLEHIHPSATDSEEGKSKKDNTIAPISPPRDPERSSISYAGSIQSQIPPPEPDPEPDLPFEFHRFIEQLRLRAADPVAKFLRSFLQEFGKKQWQVHEQVKIIGDFLTFISSRMAQCDVWRNATDAEFDNAREGMEKLVMNRLYTQTFSPEIPPSEPSPVKGRRKGTSTPLGPGRKGQHQEDVERDEVLAQKIRIYGWLREEHLDMKPFNDKGRKFLSLAQQELVKIKSYRAPRDKIICVLNSCKVIFGYLRNAQSDQSADTFIPFLIYTVLKANPDHLVSNLQYILRFRNQEKLGGEAGYYLSSLMGAVQFIENLDRTNLTVSDEEFDRNVEAAVSEIAARNEQEEKRLGGAPSTLQPPLQPEKAGPSRPEVMLPPPINGERATARRSTLTNTNTNTSDDQSGDEKAAVSGLLRTIQRPLSTIGRIFSDDATATIISPSSGNSADRPPATPQPSPRPGRIPGLHPANSSVAPGAAAAENRRRLSAEDAAALQASAEAAEAHNIMRAEHHTVVETLAGMFPDLDPDIISDVVRMKEGRIGLAVDACLLLSR